MQQAVSGGQITVNISRAVSKLKTIFFSFYGGDPTNEDLKNLPAFACKKKSNFYHPMLGNYDFKKELEYQIQIGSKMIPEYPVRSLVQSIYELKKSLGIHGSAWHSLSISQQQYMRDHFVIACDCERVLGASFSGISSKSGDLLTFKCKGANAEPTSPYYVQKISTTLNCDNILEISLSGATVYD